MVARGALALRYQPSTERLHIFGTPNSELVVIWEDGGYSGKVALSGPRGARESGSATPPHHAMPTRPAFVRVRARRPSFATIRTLSVHFRTMSCSRRNTPGGGIVVEVLARRPRSPRSKIPDRACALPHAALEEEGCVFLFAFLPTTPVFGLLACRRQRQAGDRWAGAGRRVVAGRRLKLGHLTARACGCAGASRPWSRPATLCLCAWVGGPSCCGAVGRRLDAGIGLGARAGVLL